MKTSRKLQTEVLRTRVLDAALRCFSDTGYEATTIGDIQRESQCSVGSLYHHFGSKQGIAEALHIRGIEDFDEGMLAELQGCASAEAGVKAIVQYYCRWNTKHYLLARFLLSRIDFSAEVKLQLGQMHRDHIDRVFAWFSPYFEAGEMRRLPIDTYVPLICGPVQEHIRNWLSGRSVKSLREVESLFADAAWLSVMARP